MKATIFTPPAPEPLITIEMTRREAETLRILCNYVGGHPIKSRRGDMDALLNALDRIGIHMPADPEIISGSTYTADYNNWITFSTFEDA